MLRATFRRPSTTMNVAGQRQPPRIDSIGRAAPRPFWSVMVPSYNCPEYLPLALRSVLEQAPPTEDMQIEVVDDCSTFGDIEQIVRDVGRGRIQFFRQPKNVGAASNFNTCISRATGQWVHILHADDMVLPGFYNTLKRGCLQESVGAVFSRFVYIDGIGQWQSLSPLERIPAGVLDDWVTIIAVRQRVQFPAIVVRRSVYEELGGFRTDLLHAADWEMWRRISVHFSMWYEPELLALYRNHSASDTSRLAVSGANISDIRYSIDIAREYLPAARAKRLSRQAREVAAMTALSTAREFTSRAELIGAKAQLVEALKCSRAPVVLWELPPHAGALGLRWLRLHLSARSAERQSGSVE